MSTEFGRLLAEVMHSMQSGTPKEQLKATMNIYGYHMKLKARIAELEKAYIEADDEVDNLLLEREVETGKLQARIAELEATQRWIPVSERLPETDGQYIGYTNTGLVGTHWLVDGHFVVTYSCEQNWLTTPTSWILESASGGDVYVTHWMPLPESPNDTQTQTIVYGKEGEE